MSPVRISTAAKAPLHADRPIAIGDGAGAEEISRLGLRGAEDRRGQPREHVVSRAELGAKRQPAVVHAGERAQPELQLPVRDQEKEGLTGRVLFRDPDLLENEVEVGPK